MNGTLQTDATRGARVRLSERLDCLTKEIVRPHACLDYFASANIWTYPPQSRSCAAEPAERRRSKIDFLPAGNSMRKSSFFFLQVGS
jgi:hypothetical protein